MTRTKSILPWTISRVRIHTLASFQKPLGALELIFAGLGLPFNKACKENFPLPNLAPLLSETCDDIYNGRGFAVIRGLEPDLYSPEDFASIFLGISSYIAERRGKQDQRGTMMSSWTLFPYRKQATDNVEMKCTLSTGTRQMRITLLEGEYRYEPQTILLVYNLLY
jgi:hypothetical protein